MLLSGKYNVTNLGVSSGNWSDMVAAFKGKNNDEDDIAESDIDSVTLEETEELFPDHGD